MEFCREQKATEGFEEDGYLTCMFQEAISLTTQKVPGKGECTFAEIKCEACTKVRAKGNGSLYPRSDVGRKMKGVDRYKRQGRPRTNCSLALK